MSAIASTPSDALAPTRGDAGQQRGRTGLVVDLLLAVFVVGMLVAMVATPGEETIPYHLMFLALTLVYGFRVWPMGPTALVIGTLTVVTGAVFYLHYLDGRIDAPELAEVPLMPMLLLAMVWHARRRAAAQRQVEEMAEERHRSLQREREFLRDTSHAIRTPVTIARGHVELIQGALADPTAYDDSDVVLRQLDRMNALSTRLLALARLDSAQPLNHEPLDLDSFVEQVGANWTGAAERIWGVNRRDPDQGGGVRVSADREWLELAVDAVVENAIHFTRPGDRIELSCHRDGRFGTITVVDSGAGIAPEDLPHVFDRFWHRRAPDGVPGSGLGLAMASAATHAMGGRLVVHSTLGAGASFELSLPCPDGFSSRLHGSVTGSS
jgi:signal transduction histidine kinase